MTLLRHLSSILILPVTAAVIVPLLLLRPHRTEPGALARIAGAGLLLVGLALVASTIRHFATRGGGTLAPWDPPRLLVVSGIYRHVRNPMISGVLLVLLGESLLLASGAIAVWAASFFTINAIYIPLLEEKALARRFGTEYETYKKHVPRWIPRLSAWRPAAPASEGPPPPA